MANIKNGAIGTVLTPPSGTSGTTVILSSGHGARFDNPTTKGPFFAVAYPTGVLPNFTNWEIVQVTAISTDTFTIVRAQRGSTAMTWSAGWVLSNSIMTEDMFTSSINQPEILTGTPNGVLVTFGLSQSYSMLWLFKNGAFMQPGAGNDYTLNTAGNAVTFATPPAAGAKLIAIGITGQQAMISGSNSPIPLETPVGTINGVNPTFTVSKGSYIGGTLYVFINGILQDPKLHYVETSPGSGVFTMSDAPLTGDNVLVGYWWTNSVTGNADTVDGFNASATPIANTIPVLDSSTKLPSSVIPAPSSWVTPTLATGWTAFDAGTTDLYGFPQYQKDAFGYVHLKGLAKNNSGGTNTNATNALIFTLPAGFRPFWKTRIPVSASSAFGEIDISASGTVVLAGPVTVINGQWVGFNSISFLAEQ